MSVLASRPRGVCERWNADPLGLVRRVKAGAGRQFRVCAREVVADVLGATAGTG
ncbi:MAG TPA: hypothetical protein VGD45_11750 [Steroidobacter sp.]|uniref:hypothetical protein n=1 Tax=Steroidobacter sp. TaxID=1978227 RepID=UPI002EDB134C